VCSQEAPLRSFFDNGLCRLLFFETSNDEGVERARDSRNLDERRVGVQNKTKERSDTGRERVTALATRDDAVTIVAQRRVTACKRFTLLSAALPNG